MSSGRTDPSASRLARPRPTPPSRRAPPRPDLRVLSPDFGFEKSNPKPKYTMGKARLGGTGLGGVAQWSRDSGCPVRPRTNLPFCFPEHTFFQKFKTQKYHGQVGSGRRTAGRRGGAGRGGSGRRRVCPPRRHRTLLPPRGSTATVLDDFPEARTSQVVCKPTGEPKTRVCVLSALVGGQKSALHSWLLTSGPSPTGRLMSGLSPGPQPLFVHGFRTKSRFCCCRPHKPDDPKPNTPRAGLGGAAHGGAAWRGGAGQDVGGTVRPRDNRPACPQGIVDNCSGRLFASTNKQNLI